MTTRSVGGHPENQPEPAPVVTLVVPCYKQAQFLPETLATVVAQAFTAWEIIIVNDGSPDDTSAVARQLISTHAGRRIRLIEKPNGGLADARNAGVAAAAGRYYVPLDADDKIAPAFLEKTVAILETQPEVGFCYTNFQRFGLRDDVTLLPEFDAETMVHKQNIGCGCALVRRAAWEQVGGYNARMRDGYEDWDFWIGCVGVGWLGWRIPEVLFYYRKHPSSMTRTITTEMRERLIARIVLNHPKLYSPERVRRAALELEGKGGAGKSKQVFWPGIGQVIKEIRSTFEATPAASNISSAEAGARAGVSLDRPKISVLIPTYNYGRFLPEAIESVLAQDFQDFELLIVDDGSTDGTAAAVAPYCARDPRVRFSVNPSNLGMVNNWNHCLEMARGDYIKFLFGDDKLWHPQALGKMVNLLESHPTAVLAASARAVLDEWSRVVDVYRDLADGCHDGRKIMTACLMRNGKNVVGEPSVVMFRKSDARRGFDPQYLQIVDVEMWFRLLEKGDLVYTREPLCAFRCHSLQQTERNTDAGIAWKEHAIFIASQAVQPQFPRETVFPILFHLRRWRGRNPDADSPEMLEWQRRLATRWGAGWRWPYWLYCLRYRMAKPFRNLAHSAQKRLFRRRFRTGAASG